MYDYNYWADRRILAACAKVSKEQCAAPTSFGVGHGSLRATLLHILDGEWQWRLTCTGFYNVLLTTEDYRATELTEAEFPAFKDLERRWQAVNHATLHRGETAALLTSCGQSPGDFDFTLFLNEYFHLRS